MRKAGGSPRGRQSVSSAYSKAGPDCRVHFCHCLRSESTHLSKNPLVPINSPNVAEFDHRVLPTGPQFIRRNGNLDGQLLILTFVCDRCNNSEGRELVANVILEHETGPLALLLPTNCAAEVDVDDVSPEDIDFRQDGSM